MSTNFQHNIFLNLHATSHHFLNYFRVEIEETFPVKLKNGYTIHAGPPPGSSIILAYILRLLDGILPAPDVGLDAHRLVEAFKYGYAERTHLGDHKFVNVSQVCFISQIILKKYAI